MSRHPPRRLTPEQEAALVADFDAGVPIAEIMRRYDLRGHETVRRIAERHGRKTRGRLRPRRGARPLAKLGTGQGAVARNPFESAPKSVPEPAPVSAAIAEDRFIRPPTREMLMGSGRTRRWT